jgi:phosphate starvation-inducible PhoH-like protein
MSKNARRFTRRKKQTQDDLGNKTTRKPHIELKALTATQSVYIAALNRDPVILVTGCAGTGKTFMAATQAAKMYSNRSVTTIVITRPNIAAGGKGIGFFPGSLEQKMSPWVAPIVDVLKKHLGSAAVEIMIKHGDLKIEPFETLRGKSFENAFIILDEAQNCTYEELKLFLTRLGENTKAVINGDVAQTDLAERSGLRKVIGIVKDQLLPFPVIEFTERDIVRSDVCATWIRAFSKYEKRRK